MPPGEGPIYEDEPTPDEAPAPTPASHRRRDDAAPPPPRERWRAPAYDDPPADEPDPALDDPAGKDPPPLIRRRY
jgi:hypothetical protein